MFGNFIKHYHTAKYCSIEIQKKNNGLMEKVKLDSPIVLMVKIYRLIIEIVEEIDES